MSRMKTFFKYAMWVILFFILSEVLINIGLNSSYRDIKRRDNLQQIEITEAQATAINGKVKGIIKNSEEDYLTGKYLKIDLYSKRDNNVGTKYVEIKTTEANKTQEFGIHFELNEVTSYEISIVEEKTTAESDGTFNGFSRAEIFMAKMFLLLTL